LGFSRGGLRVERTIGRPREETGRVLNKWGELKRGNRLKTTDLESSKMLE